MKRGDYVVRFWADPRGGHIGTAADLGRLASAVHRDVIPVVHSSGALEILRPGAADTPMNIVVVFGPGAWHSLTTASPAETRVVTSGGGGAGGSGVGGSGVVSASSAGGVGVGGASQVSAGQGAVERAATSVVDPGSGYEGTD